ncbi:MAG: glycosyltransferase family 2 protein [Clostridia bacterium]|nr:glycosyltransferase family 2 protein [Clostridia bacterium]
MEKSPSVYVAILCVWALCVVVLLTGCAKIVYQLFTEEFTTETVGIAVAVVTLLLLNAAMLSYMWLGSVKDFMFSLLFLFGKKRLLKRYDPIIRQTKEDTMSALKAKFGNQNGAAPRVLLLYCTCNDFNAEALTACMQQDYENFHTVILDDSTEDGYKQKIDEFAAVHQDAVTLVRRENRVGFKAGNLNNYLTNRTDYDYFVVLDSDERIPSDYISEALKYYAYDENVGVVQAAHKATKGGNLFQNLMGLSVKSNGKICQVMKNFYGSNALIGHGMMISRECFEATHGFPQVVAEDISFAVDVKNSGFRVLYAPNIVCEEEFPVNYLCLKKRQAKWVQGNVEFMKKYNRSITDSKMTWYEKMDVKLSHYNLPIIPMMSFFIIVCTIALGFLGYDVSRYSLMIVGLMLLFLISPLIPDFFVHGRSKNLLKLLGYAFLNFVVYASLVPMMIGTVSLALFGKKAKFIVTPKEEKRISVREALRGSLDSILFAAIVGILTYGTYFSLAPTVLMVVCCTLTPIAILVANLPVPKQKQSGKLAA